MALPAYAKLWPIDVGEISEMLPVLASIVAKYIAPIRPPVCGLGMFLRDKPYMSESEVLNLNKSKYPVPFGLLIVAVLDSSPVKRSIDFKPLSPKKQNWLVYGLRAAPVKLMEEEIELGLRFVAIPVAGSMVARNTPDGLLRARPNMVEPNWANDKVVIRINEVSISDFMEQCFVNKTPS
jgi:hypothetical protein